MSNIYIFMNYLIIFTLIFSFFILLIRIPFYFLMKIKKVDNIIVYHTPTFIAFFSTIFLINQKIISINIYY